MSDKTTATTVRVSPTSQTSTTLKVRLPKTGKVCIGDCVKSW